MKNPVLITLILMFFPVNLFSQDNQISKTWITLGDDSKIKGLLYLTKDSFVQITNSMHKKDLLSGKYQIRRISYNNISNVNIISNKKIQKGAFLGAIGGTIIGAVIGFSAGYDPDYSLSFSTAYAIQLGALGLLGGTLIGASVGSFTINIPINGSIDNFNKYKNRLKKYSYVH